MADPGLPLEHARNTIEQWRLEIEELRRRLPQLDSEIRLGLEQRLESLQALLGEATDVVTEIADGDGDRTELLENFSRIDSTFTGTLRFFRKDLDSGGPAS